MIKFLFWIHNLPIVCCLVQSSRTTCRFFNTFFTSTDCCKRLKMLLGLGRFFWTCGETGLASMPGSISIELFGFTIASGLFDLTTGAGVTWISTGMSFSFFCFILLMKSALTSRALGFDGATNFCSMKILRIDFRHLLQLSASEEFYEPRKRHRCTHWTEGKRSFP